MAPNSRQGAVSIPVPPLLFLTGTKYSHSPLAKRQSFSNHRSDAHTERARFVLSIMNKHSHPGTGKISVHGNGVGVPSPEQVEKRAREIAMIDERNPNDFTEADWQEARKELMGVEGAAAPEADEDVVEEISERDEVMGESGHRVLPEGFDEEETLGEQLVTDGIEEAAHDQMVQARREELEEERSSS